MNPEITASDRKLFLNMPVDDLPASIEFFEKAGFRFSFSDDNAACMLIGENSFVMLGTREKFAEFSPRPIADTKGESSCIYGISVGSREAVDELVEAAAAAGAELIDGADDYGFMYSRPFRDPNGYDWNVMYMDEEAAPDAPPAAE